MHNERLLPKVTARAMGNYMKGMLPIVASDPYASARIKKTTVGREVYAEIKKFASRNSLTLPSYEKCPLKVKAAMGQ